jgi:hypothetical protein
MSSFSDMDMVVQGSPNSGPLLPPHPTKGVHHWTTGSGLVLGSYANRVTSRSRVKESVISDAIVKKFGALKKFTVPLMVPECIDGEWKNPFSIATQSQANITPHFRDSDIIECSDAYINDATRFHHELIDVGPVDIKTAINGIPGDTYINRIPMSTSGGFYFPGAKNQYFDEFEEDGFPVCYAKPEVTFMIQRIEEKYLMGERASVLFNGTLKDEPIKLSKRESGATRVFTACDVAFSLVVRKQFLKIVRWIMTNNFDSEAMVGLNCYSLDWGRLYEYLTAFGKEQVSDGDHKEFDKSMPPNIIRGGFYILEGLMMLGDTFITHSDRLIQRGIATDICFPIVNMNGDVLQFTGSNSSGHPLTIIINGLANSIYVRISYKELAPLDTFKDNVHLAHVGDDNILNTKLKEFDFLHVARTLANHGLVYTMADKTAEPVPFVGIGNSSFLKRTFRWVDERWVGPLDLNSIFKSLMMYVDRGNISHEEQLSQSYLAARREWSLHGKEIFEDYCQRMEEIFVDFPGITRFFLPQHSLTYEETREWVREE